MRRRLEDIEMREIRIVADEETGQIQVTGPTDETLFYGMLRRAEIAMTEHFATARRKGKGNGEEKIVLPGAAVVHEIGRKRRP